MHLVLVVLGALWLVPTIGLFLTSILPASALASKGWWQIFSQPSLATWSNYDALFHNSGLIDALKTTAYIAVGNTLLVVVIGALAGYAFAWLDFPGRDWIFIGVDRPARRAAADGADPDVQALRHASGSSTRCSGSSLFHVAFGLPFAIFLLRNFFVGLPKDILESARIDGASEIVIFLRLILPLGLPAIASLAIFQFLWTWNDLLVALTFGQNTTADHGLDLRPAARVRDEHRRDRAGVVHLARRAARRLLRVPALLRPGAARRLGEVMARVAIVGGGLAGFVAYLTLRRGGVRPDEITVFAPEADPAAVWRRRAEAIRQRDMRSESDGHCLPTSFPGLAVRDGAPAAVARGRSLASVCDRYHPTVDDVPRARRGAARSERLATQRPAGPRRARARGRRRLRARRPRRRSSTCCSRPGIRASRSRRAARRPARRPRLRAARVRRRASASSAPGSRRRRSG